MSWAKRGNRRYYYRQDRAGGRKTCQYLGSGPLAQAAADEVERKRVERTAQRAEVQATEKHHADAIASLDQICNLSDLLMKATLISQGFYQHDRGEWRRRHGTRSD